MIAPPRPFDPGEAELLQKPLLDAATRSEEMACALHECCQFFKDNMADFPQAAEYIKQKLCFGDYERCTRYKVFRETGRGALASLYHPGDEEEVAKISRCLRLKKERTEKP